jgi:SAM-dependent methyltransferase
MRRPGHKRALPRNGNTDESEMGPTGLVRERRGRSAVRLSHASDVERIGAFAAQVLEDLYLLVYGERPVGVRAWCDGSALLMVVRLPGPLDEDGEEPGSMLPCEGVPEVVAAAVRAQTGWRLAIGSWSVEADLGLVMIVFRVPGDPAERARARAHRRSACDEQRARGAARRALARGARSLVARLEPGAERGRGARRRRWARAPAAHRRRLTHLPLAGGSGRMKSLAWSAVASHEETIVDQFTRQAPGFAAAAPINDAGLLDLLVRASGVGPADMVLDVACGPGIVTCAFARVAAGAVGLDLVAAMLDGARAHAGRLGCATVEFVAGDVGALPFAAGSFDVVVSRFALHHLEVPSRALAEMARVCALGGTVVVCDLAPEGSRAPAFNAIERLRDPSHVRALTEAELRGLVAQTPGLGQPQVTRGSLALELDAHLARSFPASPADVGRVRAAFEASLADDRLGVGARRRDGRIEYAYPLVVLVSRRTTAERRAAHG